MRAIRMLVERRHHCGLIAFDFLLLHDSGSIDLHRSQAMHSTDDADAVDLLEVCPPGDAGWRHCDMVP